MVPMLAPDGTAGYIPSDRVNDALKMGGKLGVEMSAPDGTRGIIPRENLVAGIQAGGKVLHDSAQYTTQFEKDRAPALENSQTVRNPTSEVGHFLGGVASSAVGEAGNIVRGIPSTVKALADPLGTAFRQAVDVSGQDESRKNRGASGIERAGAIAGSVLGLNVPAVEHAADIGNAPGVVGTLAADVGVPVAAGELVKGAAKLPGRVTARLQGSLAPRMAEVPAGEPFSRGEVLDAARQNGVNLDVAQATDSGVAKGLKRANENSLASQGAYSANSTRNLAALDDWANKATEKYSPEAASREVVGGQMQQTLKTSLADAKNSASQQFNELDSRAPTSVDATNTVEAEARKIIGDNKSYYDAHPELKPKQAWGILEDLAKRPKVETEVGSRGVVQTTSGSYGTSPTTKMVDAPAKTMSWSELHQLRSDLMDFYRNNPDIVKGRGDAWIQRMVSKVDEAMTSSSSGLSPTDLEKFRAANQQWESIKSTFDNPQHPFYHAVRSQFPSQVPGMLAKGTPELAQQVRATLGSLEGPFQRQFVENLLNDKNGNLDLARLNQRLKGVPQDHLVAMLGADGAKQIRMLGQVAKRVIADSNPSGTAKVGVPAAEIGGLIAAPLKTVPELAVQNVGAKLMNSPKVVDYLTKPKVTAPLPRGSRP